MFQSATVKLTVWYVIILVSISILFSFVIYSIASTEVGVRITNLQQTNPPIFPVDSSVFNAIRELQIHEANNSLMGALIITNLIIWFAGGFGSYYLARRTLRPIEETHEAQSRFTSNASHELRTPLASMKIELEVALRDHTLRKDEMREILRSNLEEVNKLTNLSHTLLQLSRLDHGNIPRDKIDLGELTQSVVERFNKTHHRISLQNLRKLNVIANDLSIEELLTILLDNAVKYSPSDSTIEVILIKQPLMSGFKIINTGEGITPENLPHIFNRFYRADESRTDSSKKGYGLGLSLAKKIVELHNGELSVSSAPQQDTTFKVLLPNYKATPKLPRMPHR
ncbi:MAG TPA: ATP-binding protein [Candidatus Saccharimonadales bacterium]